MHPMTLSFGSTWPGWYNESLDKDHANGSVTLHYVTFGRPLRVFCRIVDLVEATLMLLRYRTF